LAGYQRPFSVALLAPPVDVTRSHGLRFPRESVGQSTKDHPLNTLSRNFKGHRFAHLVGDLLETMGYRTRVSPEGPDKGIDIVAFRDELGLHPPIIRVQIKQERRGERRVA
jgi:restriction system protein